MSTTILVWRIAYFNSYLTLSGAWAVGKSVKDTGFAEFPSKAEAKGVIEQLRPGVQSIARVVPVPIDEDYSTYRLFETAVRARDNDFAHYDYARRKVDDDLALTGD